MRFLAFVAPYVVAIAHAVFVTGCLNDIVLERGPPDPSPGGELPSGVTTLFVQDPLRRTLDFETGNYGTVMQDGEVRNLNSQLGFDTYEDGAFSVGIQGAEEGVIVDLGTEDEVSARIAAAPAAEATDVRGGFAGLAFDGAWFSDPRASQLFDVTPKSGAAAPALDRHVYVIRIVRDRAPSSKPELLVKLYVLGLDADRTATFEWARLL